MTPTVERRIALFIDFENLVTNTGLSASHFDLHPALDRLLERGKVVFRRAYCDWARFRDATRVLHDQGVELVDVPPSTRAGKNAADIRLVIDALELCYAREHIDTFAIASGDSDFCPLVYKLRENNRRVVGLGAKEATSPLLVRACDEFVYLRPSAKHEKSEPRGERSESRGGKDDGKPREKSGGREKARIPPMARQVVASLLGSATGPVNPSLIKETLVRKRPDFDEREYGFSTFSKLLAAMEKEGLLKLQQMRRQWYVVPPEHAPVTASADADGGDEDQDNEPGHGPGPLPERGPAPAPAPAFAAAPPSDEEEAYPDPDEDD